MKVILFSIAYIRGVTELVLYLVLPLEDFQNPLFRSLCQDLLAEHVLLASTHYVTTAYYLNSTIIYLVRYIQYKKGTYYLVGFYHKMGKKMSC